MFHLMLLAPALQEPSWIVQSPPYIRLVDVDRDGRLDRVSFDAAGTIEIALNRGARVFDLVRQELPPVNVAGILAGDLNDDGHVDLYLVSSGANVALLGDGSGLFVDATAELGLADAGLGLAAEQVDIDADGHLDVLLHNQGGDVIFWGSGAGYERDLTSSTGAAASDAAQRAVGSQSKSGGGKGSSPAPAPTSTGERVTPDPIDPVILPTKQPGSPTVRPAPGVTIDHVRGGGNGVTWNATQIPAPTTCALSIKDVTTSQCIKADSTPTLGRLLPLGPEFFVSAAGDVGISTTVPLARLDVAGDFCARGNFVAGRASIQNQGSDPLLLAAHTGSGLAATAEIRESSVSTDNNRASPVLQLSRTNAASDGSGGALYFQLPDNGGALREYAGLAGRVEQGLSSGVPYAGALDFMTSSGSSGRKLRMTITGAGDVGIGTTTPSSKLEVTGDFRAVGNFNAGQAALENTGTDTLLLASHSGSGINAVGDVRQASSTNDNSPSSSVLHVSRANASADGAGGALYFRLPDNGGNQREYAGIGARVEQGLSTGVPYAGALDLYTSSFGAARQRRMTITGDGDVGIGNSTPATRLDVLGDFRAVGSFSAGEAALHNSGSDTLLLAAHTGSGASVTSEIRESSSTLDESSDYSVLQLTRTNASADEAGAALTFRMADNGGVPQEVAGVAGRIEAGLGSAQPVEGALDLFTTDSGAARQRRMSITSSGDVGIGGPSPEAPLADLHLVGDPGLGRLIVAPDAGADAQAELVLGEDRDAVSSFRLVNEGATDQLHVVSDNGVANTRIAVDRDTGVVGIGTTDLSAGSPAGNGQLRVSGDVTQGLNNTGVVKAAAHIRGTSPVPVVTRSFNNLPGGTPITVTKVANGQYIVDFGADITGRFFLGTIGGDSSITGPGTSGGIKLAPRSLNPNALTVVTFDNSTNPAPADNNFYILIY
jgi:hypothetical protein